MDQPSKVASPARGQLSRKYYLPLSQFVPENLVARDTFGRLLPRQPAHFPHSGLITGDMCDTDSIVSLISVGTPECTLEPFVST